MSSRNAHPETLALHAGYRAVTGTARLHGKTALKAIGNLLTGTFEPSIAS